MCSMMVYEYFCNINRVCFIPLVRAVKPIWAQIARFATSCVVDASALSSDLVAALTQRIAAVTVARLTTINIGCTQPVEAVRTDVALSTCVKQRTSHLVFKF